MSEEQHLSRIDLGPSSSLVPICMILPSQPPQNMHMVIIWLCCILLEFEGLGGNFQPRYHYTFSISQDVEDETLPHQDSSGLLSFMH